MYHQRSRSATDAHPFLIRRHQTERRSLTIAEDLAEDHHALHPTLPSARRIMHPRESIARGLATLDPAQMNALAVMERSPSFRLVFGHLSSTSSTNPSSSEYPRLRHRHHHRYQHHHHHHHHHHYYHHHQHQESADMDSNRADTIEANEAYDCHTVGHLEEDHLDDNEHSADEALDDEQIYEEMLNMAESLEPISPDSQTDPSLMPEPLFARRARPNRSAQTANVLNPSSPIHASIPRKAHGTSVGRIDHEHSISLDRSELEGSWYQPSSPTSPSRFDSPHHHPPTSPPRVESPFTNRSRRQPSIEHPNIPPPQSQAINTDEMAFEASYLEPNDETFVTAPIPGSSAGHRGSQAKIRKILGHPLDVGGPERQPSGFVKRVSYFATPTYFSCIILNRLSRPNSS